MENIFNDFDFVINTSDGIVPIKYNNEPLQKCRGGKCMCHNANSYRRFCFAIFSLGPGNLIYIQRAPKFALSRKMAWTVHNRIISALRTVECCPRLDQFLANQYTKTNIFVGNDVFTWEKYLRDDICDFFKSHRNRFQLLWRKEKTPRLKSFLQASRFLDQIANCIGGRYETIECVHRRIFLVCFFSLSLVEYGFTDPFIVSKYLYRMIMDQRFSFSMLCLSNMGMYKVKSTIFDSVIYNYNNYTLQQLITNDDLMFFLLLNHTSISLNLSCTRNVAQMLDYLCSKVLLVSDVAPLQCNIRIFVNIWSSNILYFVPSLPECVESCENIKLCFIVPSYFIRKYEMSTRDSTWSLFFDSSLEYLDNCPENAFYAVYDKFEATDYKKNVNIRWFMKKLICSLNRDKVSIVFRDNINMSSIFKRGSPVYCVSPDIDFLPTRALAANTCFRAALNLPSFVHATESSCDGGHLKINGKCVDMDAINDTVRAMVVIMNAIIDTCGFADALYSCLEECGRPLAISVSGFHTVLMMLEEQFVSETAKTLYRTIHENIYFSAVRTSVDICKVKGPCKMFGETVYASGMVYPDLFNTKYTIPVQNWKRLREDVQRYGLRNLHFVSVSPMEEEADLLNCSASIWPIEGNKTLRKSEVLVLKRCPYKMDVCGNLTNGFLHNLLIPFYNSQMVERFSSRFNYLVGIDFDHSRAGSEMFTEVENARLRVLRDGFAYDPLEVLKLYVEGTPFIDQSHSFMFHVRDGDSIGDLLISACNYGVKAIYGVMDRFSAHLGRKIKTHCDLLGFERREVSFFETSRPI